MTLLHSLEDFELKESLHNAPHEFTKGTFRETVRVPETTVLLT